MLGRSYKENERLISGEGETEKKNRKRKKQTYGLRERPANLWVTKVKALFVGHPVTVNDHGN